MPAQCGDEPAGAPSGPLTLSGSFPARVRAAERRTFDGTVTVVNGSDARIQGLAASRPDLHVLRSGRIVAMPLPRDEVGLQLDLDPGAARELPAAGSLTSCRDGRPLPPGRYEVRAVLWIAGADPAAGGPWPLEVL
jgi:hypothetical protein